ncbi:hypothetical protein B0I32_103627 [Nonomuraea fuscirosea]|uniref:Uncharacterized protein n=1 Tax=Nonomuraea fuscirosea TaxID=1291556 RepID=A0A2T0N811_9ACTN|nr:hypothetical protein [Nonomuraea fuscirosea]PRX68665.1 hypothetical protein B0I32_103627 [Nonomuraea fuscirosea]
MQLTVWNLLGTSDRQARCLGECPDEGIVAFTFRRLLYWDASKIGEDDEDRWTHLQCSKACVTITI